MLRYVAIRNETRQDTTRNVQEQLLGTRTRQGHFKEDRNKLNNCPETYSEIRTCLKTSHFLYSTASYKLSIALSTFKDICG